MTAGPPGRPADRLPALVLRYTALRLSLFALPLIALLFTSLPAIVDVALALVVSALVSLVVGRELRDRMVVAWSARAR